MYMGSAQADISGDSPWSLGGSTGQARVSSELVDGLEINVVAVGSSRFIPSFIMISFDLLYVGPGISRAVCSYVQAVAPGCQVLMAASHTHQAPMTDVSKPGLGSADQQYIDYVVARAREALGRAIGAMNREMLVRVGHSSADHSVNRRGRALFQLSRQPSFRPVTIAPNPAGPRDEEIVAIRWDDENGTPLALVWNYACHPVGFPSRLGVSAHYPGVVRARLRSFYSAPDLPVVFLQGFSGNVRPKTEGIRNKAVEPLLRLIGRSSFEAFTIDGYRAWAGSLAELVVGAFEGSERKPPGTIQVTTKTFPLDRIVKNGIGDFQVTTARFAGLRFVAVNAEAMVEHALALRKRFADEVVVPVGCSGETFGYLPTESILKEGGYEGGGFTKYFGLSDLINSGPQAAWSLMSERKLG